MRRTKQKGLEEKFSSCFYIEDLVVPEVSPVYSNQLCTGVWTKSTRSLLSAAEISPYWSHTFPHQILFLLFQAQRAKQVIQKNKNKNKNGERTSVRCVRAHHTERAVPWLPRALFLWQFLFFCEKEMFLWKGKKEKQVWGKRAIFSLKAVLIEKFQPALLNTPGLSLLSALHDYLIR